METETKKLTATRQKAIATAIALCYPVSVVSKLTEATTETEINRIMTTARHDAIKADEFRTRSRIVCNFKPHSRGVVVFAR